MPLDPETIVCRLIRRKDWSTEGRPRTSAFNGAQYLLSLFSTRKIEERGGTTTDLCIGEFDGAGEAHLTPELIQTCAREAALLAGIGDYRIDVEWSLDDVKPAWQEWRDAHANAISSGSGNETFNDPKLPLPVRVSLRNRCSIVRAPT